MNYRHFIERVKGGGVVLSHNNEETFQFLLDKKVHFQPDYEILEMRKISLDPDIVITQEDDYVHINGLIKLQGEYEKANENLVRNQRDEATLNLVTKLSDLEGDFVQFHHHFPIDITVPAYRVNDLNDVSVSIQSFDYELQDPDELLITSNIEIDGIHIENEEHEEAELVTPTLLEHEESSNEPQEKEGITSTVSEREQTEAPSEQEARAQEMQEVPSELVEKNTSESKGAKEEAHEQVENDLINEAEVSTEEVESNEEERFVTQKIEITSGDNQDEKEVELVTEQTEDEIDVDPPVEEATVMDDQEELSRHEDAQAIEVESDDEQEEVEEQSIDIQMKESEEEQDEEVNDVDFLTTIFNRANEESYDQLRIYIVQDGDTVKSIAKHYEVSSLKLVQLNDLSSDDLSVGQLVYIPEKIETKN